MKMCWFGIYPYTIMSFGNQKYIQKETHLVWGLTLGEWIDSLGIIIGSSDFIFYMDLGAPEQIKAEVKKSKRFFWIFLLVLILGLIGLSSPRLYDYWMSRRALNAYNDYLQVFLDDKIGGETPEETLKLFAAALREGDAEKASTYFTLDSKGSREKWLRYLEESKDNFVEMADAVDTMKFYDTPYEGKAWYRGVYKEAREEILLVRNGKIWKIEIF